jgi:hypothetical protein
MYDGRDTTLEEQALGAIQAHAQNGVAPTALQLQLIAEFQRTAPRFFSSFELFAFAHGGRPPTLPRGRTASERRGRAMFDDVPLTAGSTEHLRLVLQRSDAGRGQRFQRLRRAGGSRFFGVGVSERNKLNLPVHEFILDGTDVVATPDIGMILTEPMPPVPAVHPARAADEYLQDTEPVGIRHTAP